MRLNAVYEKIKLAFEEEEGQKLPFLDTLIHGSEYDPSFSVSKDE